MEMNVMPTQNLRFIYGIKSGNDLTDNEAGLYTNNDLEIIFDVQKEEYFIGIETMILFSDHESEQNYLKELLDGFTKWMNEQGYQIDHKPWLYGVFTQGDNINTGFKTIKDLYANFKFLVNGYINF
jgi:hypothetical protein